MVSTCICGVFLMYVVVSCSAVSRQWQHDKKAQLAPVNSPFLSTD